MLGYLAAGLAIGPYGLGLVTDADTLLHVAEFGVVMFLFVIGLEMQPARLWSLRRDIFGLGAAQVAACGGAARPASACCSACPRGRVHRRRWASRCRRPPIVMQMLDERGEHATPRGQRIVSILLFEDLAIVPLLALVALLAPRGRRARRARAG